MADFLEEARALFPYTQSVRRDLHIHPELGFHEVRTGGIVAKELEALGLEVTKGVGKTGVVGLMEGSKPGPTLLIRFDMDALPIVEETGAVYASQNNGVMHACGHDGHTAIGLTVAKILQNHRDLLAGPVKFCFQPAEETIGPVDETPYSGNGGNQAMILDGVLDAPKVDKTLALHLWNDMPVGWVGVGSGPVMAGADLFTVRLTGRGGHGAAPHLTIDPIVTAAQIVTALQTITSRNVAPLKSAVVSVTTVHSGTAFNVIPQAAELTGTIRTFEPEVRSLVLDRFEKIVAGIAETFGCQQSIEITRVTPPVFNNDSMARTVRSTTQRVMPSSALETSPYLTMGAEDMAFMQEKVPGCYFFVGSNNKERHLDYGHHHPKFDFDEEALPRAAALMAAAAIDVLNA